MEINESTTGANAASALIGSLGQTNSVPSTKLTADQQAAVQTAVGVLLGQAGIADGDEIEVHLSANPDGKWAVLRVAYVVPEG